MHNTTASNAADLLWEVISWTQSSTVYLSRNKHFPHKANFIKTLEPDWNSFAERKHELRTLSLKWSTTLSGPKSLRRSDLKQSWSSITTQALTLKYHFSLKQILPDSSISTWLPRVKSCPFFVRSSSNHRVLKIRKYGLHPLSAPPNGRYHSTNRSIAVHSRCRNHPLAADRKSARLTLNNIHTFIIMGIMWKRMRHQRWARGRVAGWLAGWP